MVPILYGLARTQLDFVYHTHARAAHLVEDAIIILANNHTPPVAQTGSPIAGPWGPDSLCDRVPSMGDWDTCL